MTLGKTSVCWQKINTIVTGSQIRSFSVSSYLFFSTSTVFFLCLYSYLSLSLSFSLTIYIYMYIYICVCVCVCVCEYVYVCMTVDVCVCVCGSLHVQCACFIYIFLFFFAFIVKNFSFSLIQFLSIFYFTPFFIQSFHSHRRPLALPCSQFFFITLSPSCLLCFSFTSFHLAYPH